MKRIGRFGSTSAMFPAVLAAVLLLTLAGPAGAVLPPGAHESLAAKAPVVVIAGVERIGEIKGVMVAQCRVLAPGRGNLQQGQVISVMVDRPPARPVMGPAARYHQLAAGQVWLLLLMNPDGFFAKHDPRLGSAYHIASSGWYTTRLDNLTSSRQLMSQLSNMSSPRRGENERKLMKIYQWAGAWLDQNAHR